VETGFRRVQTACEMVRRSARDKDGVVRDVGREIVECWVFKRL
jgi:hypothetical protein